MPNQLVVVLVLVLAVVAVVARLTTLTLQKGFSSLYPDSPTESREWTPSLLPPLGLVLR
jgi:hypothetical protein